MPINSRRGSSDFCPICCGLAGYYPPDRHRAGSNDGQIRGCSRKNEGRLSRADRSTHGKGNAVNIGRIDTILLASCAFALSALAGLGGFVAFRQWRVTKLAQPAIVAQELPSAEPNAAVFRFTCTPRHRPEPMVPFQGGSLEGDEKAYAFVKRMMAPYKSVRTDIAYTSDGWQLRDTQANGEINLPVYKMVDTTDVETFKAEHFLEWRGSEGLYKYIGRLKLDGSGHATLYFWGWFAMPMDCSVNDWEHGYCRPLPPTDKDLGISDCIASKQVMPPATLKKR
jgi:hypothetical protein